MNQPTEEQIRWFWEQCADEWKDFNEGKHRHYLFGSEWVEDEPGIDLNNLFKYAVPKGSCVSFTETGCDITNCILTTPELKITQGRGKSEALALFWASYKAFGGENGS